MQINKIFFSLVILMQVYTLIILNFRADPIQLIFILFYTIFSFYRPLWSLSLFFALIPLTELDSLHMQSSCFITISSSLLLGIYSDLIIRDPIRLKRFIVKTQLNSIVLILITMYTLTLLFSLLGQPLYNLIVQTYDNPLILIQLFNITQESVLYPFKSTFISIQAILLGLYVFAIVKHSNQVIVLHHLMLALIFGLIVSIIGTSIDLFSIDPSLYSQYLVITLPFLPVILLLHKINKFYFTLIILLLLIGGTTLILSMTVSSLLIFPFLILIICIMIYFIFIRTKKKQNTLASFLKFYWKGILLSFSVSILLMSTLAYLLKADSKYNNLSTTEIIKVYTEDQNNRANSWSLGSTVLALNPIYGTGMDSFHWKAIKLQQQSQTPILLNSLYLNTAVGNGLIGLTFFLSFILIIFYKILKKEFADTYVSLEVSILGLMIFGSLASILLYANINNVFDSNPVVYIFWLSIFMGISLTHRYTISKKEQYRRKKFLKYITNISILLLVVHIFNFTAVKEYLSEYITDISYLLWVMIIGIAGSLIVHSKIIFFSVNDTLFIDSYGSEKSHAVHNSKIPRVGGIGIFLSNIFLIFNPIGLKLLLISLPTFIIGLIDDIESISPRVRLLFQTLSAILAVLLLNTVIYSIGFSIVLPLWLGIIFSIIAIIGVTNAINIIDGFNGLASGIALMVLSSFAFLCFSLDDMLLFEVIIINIIALIGFLILNFPKGKIFLGDGGAYFIGFSLAIISLLIINTHHEVSVFYPLALLIYPVWEVLFSIYRRKIIKKLPSIHADKVHLHQLIYRRIVKNNPKTTLYIWKRVSPFILLATYFYDNDIALLVIIVGFITSYNLLYKKIINKLKKKSL